MNRSFTTRVGEAGEWPELPPHWSFSTLREVEGCPLRYALRVATYKGDGVGGEGYPEKVSEAAVVGVVMHAAVEQVVRVIRSGPRASDPSAAVDALRRSGGYPAIIEGCIERVASDLSSNPRMSARAQRLGANLRRRAPEIRSTVQAIVARLPQSDAKISSVSQGSVASRSGPRRPLGLGAHPEARLRSDDKRFKGQIDLLTVNDSDVEIVDFKSGRPEDHHEEQVTLYGCLWGLDAEANPNRLPVGKMSVAYRGGELDVPLPATWSDVEDRLAERIYAADESISGAPSARPSEACAMCSVRHMCEVYWDSDYLATVGSFGDAQVDVHSRRGPLSWRARLNRTGEEVLLRTTSEDVSFADSSTVRLLDVVCERQDIEDGASSVVVLTAVASSEMFELVGR